MGWNIALVGSTFYIIKKASLNLKEVYPNAKLYCIPTPCPLNEEKSIEIVKKIKKNKAKVMLVALGAPKQERWIQNNIKRLYGWL